MKKIILSLLFVLSIAYGVTAQSQGTFFFLTTIPCIQDSGSPVIPSNKAFVAIRHASVLQSNDSVFYTLIGQGSKSASNLSDSLIMPVPFKNGNTSGIMDIGIRADSAGLDSIMIYQSNVKIYTYKTGAHFANADVYFPFQSGVFILPNRFVVKPVVSRSSSKKRTIYVNPNYYQQ